MMWLIDLFRIEPMFLFLMRSDSTSELIETPELSKLWIFSWI